ncbi:MAG: hypothetical protein JWR69_2833, partial [Pedosphaera sp.]|nr:hypothetical protein [Pedosphaera sp.]
TADNALIMSSATGLTNGTLTLATPATYAKLAILAHSASVTNQVGTLKLNFSDGTSFVTSYFAPDWVNGTAGVAWFGNGRITVAGGNDTGGTLKPLYYQTTINVAGLLGATNKPLASITFGKTASASTAIYAVGGLVSPGATPVATPVVVTGFNRDLVIENSAAGPPYTSAAQEFNPGEGYAFYQSGLPGKFYGLPVSGGFNSIYDGTLFQFQPYTANNALVLSSATALTSGTLTLTSPAVYNSVAVIANSANATASSIGVWTLHFADGSSYQTTYNAFDWFSNPGFALQGVERIGLTSGATQGGGSGDPRFYQTTLNLVALFGATNKPLASLTFGKPTGVGATAVYAVSGVRGNQTNGIYTLPVVATTTATGVQIHEATMGGNVSSTGGAVPEVLLYFGPVDGGTNAANWTRSIYLGAQGGGFSQKATGLSGNTTYYYRAAAVNPTGVAWSAPSKSFTTPAASLATITNLPASNIGPTVAVISGTALSTGADAPVITLFYGPANGGTTPGAWAQSLPLPGSQNGWFGQAISGLMTNTTYYFTARAANAAGAAWGTPVQSFTTLATNPAPSNLVTVPTGRNDNGRTGQNTNETILTPANVNTNNFGKLFSYGLDGMVMAQPLVLPNVTIPGSGVHNLVIAATEHDSVYALDADSDAGPNAAPLWHVSFINPAAGTTAVQSTTDLQASSSPGFYGPEVGISGTPVIDPATGTIYVEAKTREVVNSVTNFVHRLHALDAATGAEKFGGPVVIQGAVPGVGDDYGFPGNVDFNAWKHMNRPALLLNNGVLCVTFASHQDFPPYHGWVFTYNAYTLEPLGVFNTTPNGSAGAIWQASSGPAADAAGNIYFETGNGTFDAFNQNYGDSVLKLSTVGGLSVADYFAPYNQLTLNLQDLDIGSAGLMLLPDSAGSATHPHLLVAGSKTGVFWLLDRDNLGQFNPAGDTQVVQAISGATRGMFVTPAYFNGKIYYCCNSDNVKSFAISNAVINTTPTSLSTGTIGYPGSSLSISANGTNNGIVWGLDTSGNQSRPAVLHAYNATNLAQELYNSSQNLARDNPGPAIKFTMPTIANGKVYVGAVNQLSVFGNVSFLATPVIAPSGGIFTNSVVVSMSSPSNGVAIYYTLDGSTPTTNSVLYTGPFTLTNTTAVLAVATVPGQPNSGVAAASFFNSASLGNGTGLIGQYYSNTDYTTPFVGSPLVRTDATINFDWNTVSPNPAIPTNNYTVRWTGMVQPLFSQTYTFVTTTDDGMRLWVNGQLIIDHWAPQSPTTWSGSIALQALQLYSLEMDYNQEGGGAVAQLFWSSPSTTQSIIPQSQLYPFSSPLPLLFSSGHFTNGVLSLQLSGMPGRSYVLQASTDLVNWVPLSTNVPPATVLNLIDPSATNFPSRFYRALQLP